MPFEPLKTDEPLTGPSPRRSDFEAQLMAGCTTIGLASFITYGLVVWPFLAIPEYTWKGLLAIVAFGAGGASVFGVVSAARFGLAGAAGFFGGALAGSVFIHLRLQQTLLGRFARDLPRPEYGDWVGWALPAGWFAWSAVVAYAPLRKWGSEV